MSLIQTLGRQRQGITEFKASLVCKVSSRTFRTTWRNPVLKIKTKPTKQPKPKTNKKKKKQKPNQNK
jgi:hypothetical protein